MLRCCDDDVGCCAVGDVEADDGTGGVEMRGIGNNGVVIHRLQCGGGIYVGIILPGAQVVDEIIVGECRGQCHIDINGIGIAAFCCVAVYRMKTIHVVACRNGVEVLVVFRVEIILHSADGLQFYLRLSIIYGFKQCF